MDAGYDRCSLIFKKSPAYKDHTNCRFSMENLIRGAQYELQVLDNILTRPETTAAWLWRNCPEDVLEAAGLIHDYNRHRINRRDAWSENVNPLRDTGADVVSQVGKKYVLNQAKNYSETVCQDSLAGIYRLALFYGLDAEVFYNNKVSGVCLDMPPSFKRFKYTQLPYKEYVQTLVDAPVVGAPMLRDYQQEAVQKCKDAMESVNRTILASPCGTGKTLVGANVCLEYKNVVIMSHWKAHAEQAIDRAKEVLKDHTPLIVDSDGIRDEDELERFVDNNDKWVMSSVYKSADVIWETVKDLDRDDLIVCIDEFHNISARDLMDSKTPMYKLLHSDIKILFMSATPRVYDIEGEEDESRFDQLFGDVAYSMKMTEAIDRGIITDYRVFCPLLTEEGDEDVKKELSVENVDDKLLSKAVFLAKGMLQQGSRKAIVYLTTHEEVKDFHDVFTKVADEYFGIGPGLYCSAILSYDSKETRAARLKAFADAEDFAVLLSAQILDEAIDLPSCDSILFANPCRSKVKCVQRVCRSVRKDPMNPVKVAKVFVWSDTEGDTITFIGAMKEVDPNFHTKIEVISRRYGKIKKKTQKEVEAAGQTLVKCAVEVQEYKRTTDNREAKALENARKYASFVEECDRHPSQQSKNEDERSLAVWAFNYRRGVNGNNQCKVYTSVNSLMDAQAPGWNSLRVMKALESAREVLAFVEEHARFPRNVSDEKTLYNWLETQKSAQKGKKDGSRAFPETIHFLDDKLPGWQMTDIERKSLFNAKQLIAWVQREGKLPVKNKKDQDEHRLRVYLDNYKSSLKPGGKSTSSDYQSVTTLLQANSLL